jgi:hypothetical protein
MLRDSAYNIGSRGRRKDLLHRVTQEAPVHRPPPATIN